MSAMATYTILLDPDLDNGGYTVTVPALPGCVTEGETVVECVQNAEEAIRLYLDDLHDAGEPVPEEKVVPQAITVTVAA
jgi:antitoxin HicB